MVILVIVPQHTQVLYWEETWFPRWRQAVKKDSTPLIAPSDHVIFMGQAPTATSFACLLPQHTSFLLLPLTSMNASFPSPLLALAFPSPSHPHCYLISIHPSLSLTPTPRLSIWHTGDSHPHHLHRRLLRHPLESADPGLHPPGV